MIMHLDSDDTQYQRISQLNAKPIHRDLKRIVRNTVYFSLGVCFLFTFTVRSWQDKSIVFAFFFMIGSMPLLGMWLRAHLKVNRLIKTALIFSGTVVRAEHKKQRARAMEYDITVLEVRGTLPNQSSVLISCTLNGLPSALGLSQGIELSVLVDEALRHQSAAISVQERWRIATYRVDEL